MKAWHFVGPTLRDGRPVPADGQTLVHDGELVLCQSGLHASRRIIDALRYAPGSTICRVELGGEIVRDNDKVVARERTILWRVDGEDLLRDFARRCALDVIYLWDAPDVVVRYLRTGDGSLRAASWAAARDAARAAARDAARAAALDAARAAALDASWAASRAASWAAARAAALDASWAASWAMQNRRLTSMVAARKVAS